MASGWSGVAGADGPGEALQPVAPIRKTPQPLLRDNGDNPLKKSQVTLRWRPSGQTTTADPVPAKQTAATTSRSLMPVLGEVRLTPIAAAPVATPVAQVNYDQDPSDPFLDPFGDGNAFIQVTPQSPDGAIQAPPVGSGGPPSGGFSVPGLEPLPSESPAADEPAASPSQGAPPTSPFNQLPPRAELAPKTDSEPQLQGPAEPDAAEPDAAEPDATAPDAAAPSPFERSLRGSDSADSEVDSPSDRPRGVPDGANSDGLSDSDKLKILRTDCVELERRAAAQTIRRVSLDISPPFQPRLIKESDYSGRKQRFIDSQPVRTWLSKSGEELAEGSLVDIAFEKVIIATATGEELELALPQLSNDDLAYVTDAWELPSECQLPNIDFPNRRWLPMTMTWRAPDLCHKPLYFEEVNLERYGHTAGPFAQPLVSSAHFFFNIAALPYKMGIHPPNECQYALGYYRPGNCAPWIIPPVPLSLRGAMFETAAIGAGIGLIP